MTKKRKRVPAKALIIAAAAAILLVSTAFATQPEWIQRLFAGNLTVNHYERENIPHSLAHYENGVMTIDGNALEWYDTTDIDALEALRESFGGPLLVPSYLTEGEVPFLLKIHSGSIGAMAEARYQDGYYDPSTSMVHTDGLKPGFLLYQTYVGDRQLAYDLTGELYATSVNGYDAVWYGGQNGALCWIQDGILVQLCPWDLDTDYVMKVAESLAPM